MTIPVFAGTLALCFVAQHTKYVCVCLSVSVLLIMVKPCKGARKHTDAGRKQKRQGSALFKLVTQKRVIISTRERGRVKGGKKSDRIPSFPFFVP